MFEYDNKFENGDMICDDCGGENHYVGSFKDCIGQAKADGWYFFKGIHNDWTHKCPECAEGGGK